MLHRLADAVDRHRRLVLVVAALFVVLAGAFGAGAARHLSDGGFDDPGSPSSRAANTLRNVFGTGAPNLVVLVEAEGGRRADDPAVIAKGRALVALVASTPGVTDVASPWTTPDLTGLTARNGRSALVVARVMGDVDQIVHRVAKLTPSLTHDDGVVRTRVGGYAEIFNQVNKTITHDLARAEAVVVPVTAVLLIIVFGSAVAAALPLAIGVISVLGAFAALRAIASVTHVSVFAINLATSMSLGLAIDYSLFIVTRYREELRAGATPASALRTTMDTAGRTVAFSGLTVAASITALLVFPLYFLRSFAFAGIAVVALAITGALVVLPALLAVLGPRVDRYDLRRALRKLVRLGPPPPPPALGEGVWHRIAMLVMRRPLPVATAVIGLLLVLATPFLHVSFGLPDDRVLPVANKARVASDVIREQYPVGVQQPLTVVAPDTGADPTTLDARARLDIYARQLARVPHVVLVETLTGDYTAAGRAAVSAPIAARYAHGHGVWLQLIPDIEGYSPGGRALAHDVRAVPAPFPVLVDGFGPALVDTLHAIGAHLPLALLIIGVVTSLVLFLLTGSVVVPIKAITLNLLSLTATFGAMVWVFQDGHLSKWLHFTPTGLVDTTTPLLVFTVVFGLSMDYEVFLLSRIKEEYDRHGDNTLAVANGLERIGRLVSAAAGLLAIVFIAFASSGITFIKLLGVGTALAVFMDATLIRGALVPAFMRVMGRANWWAPRSLRILHKRIGLRESPSASVPRERVLEGM